MDKLTFKYDIMYVFNDRYEFKSFKKKSFFKILSDIFIYRAGYALLGCVFVVLILHLILQLIHVPIEEYINSMIAPFFFFLIVIITIYYSQHKNVTILISSIQKLHVNKNRKSLIIEYNDVNKRLKVKSVDMPDTDSARQDIINQLNEANIFVENNDLSSDSLMQQIKFYRINLYMGIIGLLIGLIFLVVLLKMLAYNLIVLLCIVFALSLCAIISIYSIYKLTKLKNSGK
jgi:hypothetical protein